MFRDCTGWSQAAIDYILSMDAVGIDVVPRAVKLNNNIPELPKRILELEKRSSSNPDIVIQNVLPHQMDYNGLISKNIGLYTTETTNFKTSSWARNINTLDEAWVFNKQSAKASYDSGVEIPIRVIPPGSDVSRFNKSYEPLSFRKKIPNDFIFYTIGETNRRKNLSALIKAFHIEFSPEEPVQLLIKTTPVNIRKSQHIEGICNEVKQHLKLYPDISSYKKEIIITDYLSENNLMRLHSTCDCFVLPSYGEAWAIPAFDAMGMGRAVICSDFGGFKEYLSNENGWLIPGRLEPVFGVTNSFPDMFTGKESWLSVDILELQKAMREAYENTQLRKLKTAQGIKTVNEFSYEKTGEKIKKILLS